MSGTKFTVQTIVAGGVCGIHALLEASTLWTDIETLEDCVILLIPPQALAVAQACAVPQKAALSNVNERDIEEVTVDGMLHTRTSHCRTKSNIAAFPTLSRRSEAGLASTTLSGLEDAEKVSRAVLGTPENNSGDTTQRSFTCSVSLAGNLPKEASSRPSSRVATGVSSGKTPAAMPFADQAVLAAAAEISMREAAVSAHVDAVSAGDLPSRVLDTRFTNIINEIVSDSTSTPAAVTRLAFLFPDAPIPVSGVISRNNSSVGSLPGNSSISSRQKSKSRSPSPYAHGDSDSHACGSSSRSRGGKSKCIASMHHTRTPCPMRSRSPTQCPLIAVCNTVREPKNMGRTLENVREGSLKHSSNCIQDGDVHALHKLRTVMASHTYEKPAVLVPTAPGGEVLEPETSQESAQEATCGHPVILNTQELAARREFKAVAARMRELNDFEDSQAPKIPGIHGHAAYQEQSAFSKENLPGASESTANRGMPTNMVKSLAAMETMLKSAKDEVLATYDGIEVMEDAEGGDALRVKILEGSDSAPVRLAQSRKQCYIQSEQSGTEADPGEPLGSLSQSSLFCLLLA